MASDCVLYGHDVALRKATNPPRAVPQWHLSEAKKLLKEDVLDGKHKKMKPKELYHMREENKVVELKKFRNHIYQQRDAEIKNGFRFKSKRIRGSILEAQKKRDGEKEK